MSAEKEFCVRVLLREGEDFRLSFEPGFVQVDVSAERTNRVKLAAIRQAVSAGVMTEDEASVKIRALAQERLSNSAVVATTTTMILGLDHVLTEATARIQEEIRDRARDPA